MAETELQRWRLPPEVIYKVMTCLLPTRDNAIIPHSDPAAKVLLAFSAVSWATREEAVKYLKKHCIYIDDPLRVEYFTLGLLGSKKWPSDCPNAFEGITSIHVCIPTTLKNVIEFVSLSMLFKHAGPSLRRAVVEWPGCRLLMSEHEEEVAGNFMIEGILSMVKLEELICETNFYFLLTRIAARFLESKPMGILPALKRLGIYSIGFYRPLPNFPSIEQIVVQETCIYQDEFLSPAFMESRRRRSKKPVELRVLLTPDSGDNLQTYHRDLDSWLGTLGRKCFRTTMCWLPEGSCAKCFWVRAALAGELWDLGSDDEPKRRRCRCYNAANHLGKFSPDGRRINLYGGGSIPWE
ncbi:hypothetical protein Hte_005290 [Hypoxylon texense]